MSGEKRNCIEFHVKPKMPVIEAARAMSPPSSWMTSFGRTGTMMPRASMSSATVTKINANAARLAGCDVEGAGADTGAFTAASQMGR